jgi:hypothetical protein
LIIGYSTGRVYLGRYRAESSVPVRRMFRTMKQACRRRRIASGEGDIVAI